MLTKNEFLTHLRCLADEAGTQQELAHRLGISTAHLSDVLNERRDPAEKLLSAVGFEKVVLYRKSEDK